MCERMTRCGCQFLVVAVAIATAVALFYHGEQYRRGNLSWDLRSASSFKSNVFAHVSFPLLIVGTFPFTQLNVSLKELKLVIHSRLSFTMSSPQLELPQDEQVGSVSHLILKEGNERV